MEGFIHYQAIKPDQNVNVLDPVNDYPTPGSAPSTGYPVSPSTLS